MKKSRKGSYVAKIAKVVPIGKKAIRVTLELRPSKRGNGESEAANTRALFTKGLRKVARAQLTALKGLDSLL